MKALGVLQEMVLLKAIKKDQIRSIPLSSTARVSKTSSHCDLVENQHGICK